MEQCFGCLGVLFGSRRRNRLRHMVKYKDDISKNIGVEFENLMHDENAQSNYGTDLPVITAEEREYIAKRDYNKIIEEQKKVDEQIHKQLFEEEELLRVEEASYYEAQKEAARAASMTLMLKEKSSSIPTTIGTSSRDSLALEEVEDDFEDFLEEVRSRSEAFRSKFVQNRNDEKAPGPSQHNLTFDRGGDGMSSDDDFIARETQLQTKSADDQKWNDFTSGEAAADMPNSNGLPAKRLEPVGIGSTDIHPSKPIRNAASDPVVAAERMFSITDDEDDMGDFVHA